MTYCITNITLVLIINFEIIDFHSLITITPRLQFLLFLIIEKLRKYQRKIEAFPT